MTIVSRNIYLDPGAPKDVLYRLEGEVQEVLLKALQGLKGKSRRGSAYRALFLFDCLLRIAGIPSIAKKGFLRQEQFGNLQETFYGALYSNRFVAYSLQARAVLARSFEHLLRKASEEISLFVVPISWPEHKKCPNDWIIRFDSLVVDSEQENNLRGYWLEDKHGGKQRIRLDAIGQKIGYSFCSALYVSLCNIARSKAKDTAIRDFANTLNDFVASHSVRIKEARLRRVAFTQEWFSKFMRHHFEKYTRTSGGPREGTLPSLQKLWSRYVNYIEAIGKTGLWAVPTALPTGNLSLTQQLGPLHRKTMSVGGTKYTYTQKLLTPVPLHVTDAEAIQILFSSIEQDYERVKRWASAGVQRLRFAFEESKRLESASEFAEQDTPSTYNHFRPRANQNALANTIWAIRHLYGGYVDTTTSQVVFYPHGKSSGFVPKSDVASAMGLLGKSGCFLFAAHLMAAEPRLTESALLTARAFGPDGQRLAPVDIDGGVVIAIPKDRARKYHEIVLGKEAAEAVQLLLTLTDPIRQYMKQEGIPGWQNLFVYCRTPLGKPVVFPKGYSVYTAFREFVRSERDTLGHLVDTITLPQIRASAGVLTFIKTLDLHKMADVLGNEAETSLRHYLPETIWQFFADRWIRIFQNLLIQKAVRGTSFGLAASDFTSVADLDEFLTNNCLMNSPNGEEVRQNYLISSVGRATTDGQIIVIAERDIWAALLGVMSAVDAALSAINPIARYWAEFARKLVAHVDSPKFTDREIKAVLAEARRYAQPERFIGLIHAEQSASR